MEKKKKQTSTLTITIEVTGGTHEVRVSDSAGNEKTVDSIFIAGLGGSDLYCFGWGHPYQAARGVAEGISRGVYRGDDWYENFMSMLSREFMMRCQEPEKVDPEELVKRWEKEDKERERFLKGRLS
jgi:hypothetical protein